MQITRFGHSCLLVEEGGVRLLLDPGTFSDVPADLGRLDALLLTHAHPDHLDPDTVGRLDAARVIADSGSANALGDRNDVQVVDDGDRLDVGGVPIEVHGSEHAEVLPTIPRIPNVGYLIGGRLFHPGDALLALPVEVEVLALPVAAPWSKISEVAAYVGRVRPRVVVPIHERVLANPAMVLRILADPIAAAGARVIDSPIGEAVEV